MPKVAKELRELHAATPRHPAGEDGELVGGTLDDGGLVGGLGDPPDMLLRMLSHLLLGKLQAEKIIY